MKRGTVEHPKMRHLAELLGIELAYAVGIMEMLWHFTARFAPQGDIGKYPDKMIAEAVGWKRPTGAKGVTPECKLSDALVTAKWVDRVSRHRLVVHDWHIHADESVRKYLSRHSLQFVSLPLPLPLPEPLPVPVSLTRQTKGLPQPIGQDFEVRFDALYIAHPKPGFRDEAKFLYTDIITTSVHPDAVADDIDAKHKIWLSYWLEHSGFIPTLAQWFRDRYYLKEPREPPKQLGKRIIPLSDEELKRIIEEA